MARVRVTARIRTGKGQRSRAQCNRRKKRPVRSKFVRPVSRSYATPVLAQGVGATTTRAFGNRSPMSETVGKGLQCWDARLPAHLPLPRAVGPYLTVRTTKRFSSDSTVIIFGCFTSDLVTGPRKNWTNIAAVESNDSTLAINANGNSFFHCYETAGFGKNSTLTPSAITVQVMNPDAIGKTTGICYGGRSDTQLPFGGSTLTWNALGENFLQFQRPRLMSAGKLALRGVQASSYPMNMSMLADFTPLSTYGDGNITWTNTVNPVGFAPIVWFAPTISTEDKPKYEFLVTCEWRCRFDITEAASAAHVHHPVASDSLWNHLMKLDISKGPSMEDISDVVANIGKLAGAARQVGQLMGG